MCVKGRNEIEANEPLSRLAKETAKNSWKDVMLNRQMINLLKRESLNPKHTGVLREIVIL